MGRIKIWMDGVGTFLGDAKAELKKVTWPAPRQALTSTAVVMVLVIIISIFLGLIDFGLARLIRLVLG
jgi:preprotein translocase subunit SecE